MDLINLFCEGLEHWCCVRHLYNNFTLLHKGLILKALFLATNRAKTASKWKNAINENDE